MKHIALLLILLTACNAPLEIPFEPGKCHRVSQMTPGQREQALTWKRWKHQPMDALYDPGHDPGLGESYKLDAGGWRMPGRVYCPKGMILSWDLDKVGTPPRYVDTDWVAHCYLNLKPI